ncbi:hypothetical protein [Halalkalicoccus salilacus]|uniref:hypothetical protein n=1 Tax=Halalkalicoccus sp. GCM10025704 TaxID=3252662 RepID=UPI003606163E
MADASDPDLTETERGRCTTASWRSSTSTGRTATCSGSTTSSVARWIGSTRRRKLRSEGHEELANELRDEHLPAGAYGDDWSYALVEGFRTGLLDGVDGFETELRDELAGGLGHVSERRQRRRWRKRAGRDE